GPAETFEIADLNVVTNGNLGFSHSIQRSVFTDKDGKKLDITLRVTDAYRKVNGTGNDIQAPRHFTKGAPGANASVTIDRFCSALQYRRRSAQLGSSHRLCTAANQSRALTPGKIPRSARPHCHQKCLPTGHIFALWLSVLFGRDAQESCEISGLIRSLALFIE